MVVVVVVVRVVVVLPQEYLQSLHSSCPVSLACNRDVQKYHYVGYVNIEDK